MKSSKALFCIYLLLLSTGPAFPQEASWSYQNSELKKQNLYAYFLQGEMKPNFLAGAKKARAEIIARMKDDSDFSLEAFRFLPDASAIELSYLLYWFSFHKIAIEDGRQPYWVKNSDFQSINFEQLSWDIQSNIQPGIITRCLLKIAEEIVENPEYLVSGRAERDIQEFFEKFLWCRRKQDFDFFVYRSIERLKTREIKSVIDEFAKDCEQWNPMVVLRYSNVCRLRISSHPSTTPCSDMP